MPSFATASDVRDRADGIQLVLRARHVYVAGAPSDNAHTIKGRLPDELDVILESDLVIALTGMANRVEIDAHTVQRSAIAKHLLHYFHVVRTASPLFYPRSDVVLRSRPCHPVQKRDVRAGRTASSSACAPRPRYSSMIPTVSPSVRGPTHSLRLYTTASQTDICSAMSQSRLVRHGPFYGRARPPPYVSPRSSSCTISGRNPLPDRSGRTRKSRAPVRTTRPSAPPFHHPLSLHARHAV